MVNCCRAGLGRNDGLAVERANARRPDDEMLLAAILSVSKLGCRLWVVWLAWLAQVWFVETFLSGSHLQVR